ncbi:hypothetical protein [Kitasatospora mediocidica]|nr:hypothetical protein [Kitasatospora mediocidica]
MAEQERCLFGHQGLFALSADDPDGARKGIEEITDCLPRSSYKLQGMNS